VAAVVVFALASLGVSWTAAPRKDRSVPFPCMDRACGCHDAARCKKHCCCFSDAEKLAWAARYGVDPAPFVSEMACLSTPPRQQRSCCDVRQRRADTVSSAGRSPDSSRALRLVSIAAERQCQGLSQLWSVLAAALPSVGTTRYEFDWVCMGMVAQRTPSPIRGQDSPPIPPPRG
jgi:hypothetical protein